MPAQLDCIRLLPQYQTGVLVSVKLSNEGVSLADCLGVFLSDVDGNGV